MSGTVALSGTGEQAAVTFSRKSVAVSAGLEDRET
jgi:hypothetical protein